MALSLKVWHWALYLPCNLDYIADHCTLLHFTVVQFRLVFRNTKLPSLPCYHTGATQPAPCMIQQHCFVCTVLRQAAAVRIAPAGGRCGRDINQGGEQQLLAWLGALHTHCTVL